MNFRTAYVIRRNDGMYLGKGGYSHRERRIITWTDFMDARIFSRRQDVATKMQNANIKPDEVKVVPVKIEPVEA